MDNTPEYVIEPKATFTVTGFAKELAMPYDSMPAQKAEYWAEIMGDGRWDRLLAAASNKLQFAVNDASSGVPTYTGGVETDQEVPGAIKVAFPAGEYLVLRGTAPDSGALSNLLEGQAFGRVLGELAGYAYTGGPNCLVITGWTDTSETGELWIPLTRK